MVDDSGNVVVEYTYDMWGRILNVGGVLAKTLGEYNPLGYRRYIFDNEIQLYYINTRYYNPEIERFLTLDVILATGRDVQGANVFSYCSNQPINRIDIDGSFWNAIKGFFNKVGDFVEGVVEDVKCWVDETFGVAEYVEHTHSHDMDLFVGGYETGVNNTILVAGDDSKPVTFYKKDTLDGSSWGVSINIGKRSTSVEIGDLSLDFSRGWNGYDNTSSSLDLSLGLKRISIGYSHSRTEGRKTITEYGNVYFNTWVVVVVVLVVITKGKVLVYLVPVIRPAAGNV